MCKAEAMMFYENKRCNTVVYLVWHIGCIFTVPGRTAGCLCISKIDRGIKCVLSMNTRNSAGIGVTITRGLCKLGYVSERIVHRITANINMNALHFMHAMLLRSYAATRNTGFTL